MKIRPLIICVMILGSFAFAKAQLSTFSVAIDQLFRDHVSNGNVDYAAIKKNPKDLKDAINALKDIDLPSLSVLEREALHINAYNLFVIQGIIDAYPVKSVMDIPKFFDTKSYCLGGQQVSLNQLEKEILFKETWDEKLHFVLVCGAQGCPPLSKKPFTAANTEFLLQKLTRIAINNPSLVQLDMHEKKAYVSKIFDWYKPDFTKNQSLKDYINLYRDQKIPDGFTIGYLDYDWSLNGK